MVAANVPMNSTLARSADTLAGWKYAMAGARATTGRYTSTMSIQ
jgi:hypothetical protein